MKYTKTINLDVNKPFYEVLHAKQNDNARYLLFNLLNNGVPFVLTDKTVRAYAIKPDNTEIYNDLTIINAINGQAELRLTNQMLAVPGMIDIELVIFEGTDVLSTVKFVIEVTGNLRSEDAIESTNEFSALINALASIDDLEVNYTPRLNAVESSLSNIVTKTSTWISVTDFGAKGDGITDDTIPLQNAFDFAFDNKLEIRIPQGVFITTKPLKLWASNTEYGNYVTKLVGCGKGVTKIIKQGNDVSNLNNHNVDSIIIIANVMYKNGGSYVTKNDSTIISYKGYIGDITLESSDHNNKNAYGIFSLGFYYFHLYQIDFQYVNTGIYTQTWNCYNKYQRLEFNRVIYGCEFAVTEIGGNSTMNFEDCHMNGVDGCCYSIFGKATFKNCSIDGGGGTHYKAVGYDKGLAGYQSGNITLIDCHHESPSIFANNYLYELAYSHITVINTSIEIPYVNFTSESIMMKATKWSTITLMNGGIHYRHEATKTLGKIYSTDATSTLKLNNFFIDKEASLNYNHFVYSASERLPIVNRHLSDITGMSKSISYVPSGVPVEEHPKHELSFTDNRVKFNCINDFERLSSSVLMFGKKIDITNYSKICIQGSVEFTTGSGTGNVNYKVVLNKTLVADGTVSIGIPTTFDYALLPSGKMPSNYSSTDFTRYVDVTNIIGEYYVGIQLGGFSINSDIKELSLIQ